jgi:hypothetical protein
MNNISERGRTVTVNRSLIVLPLMNDIRKGEDSNCKQIFSDMSFIRGRTIKDLFTVTVLPLSDVVHQGKDD